MSRFFGIYGPRQSIEKVIPKFILKILNNEPPIVYGDGMQSRDYMYVTDAADAYARLGVADDVIGEVINIGTGIELTIADLAQKIIDLIGVNTKPSFSGKINPGEAGRLFTDPTNCMKKLDWKPEIGLEDGLKKTIDHFTKNKSLYKDLDFVI